MAELIRFSNEELQDSERVLVPLDDDIECYAKRIEDVDMRQCETCGQTFVPFYAPWSTNQRYLKFCSPTCRWARDPGVYRFVSPDGRSYVGAVGDLRRRAVMGIARSNKRLEEAFKQYPPETFVFEVLEKLSRAECSFQQLHTREQFHIERLQSWLPGRGFNMVPALRDKETTQRWRDALTAWDIRNAEGMWL